MRGWCKASLRMLCVRIIVASISWCFCTVRFMQNWYRAYKSDSDSFLSSFFVMFEPFHSIGHIVVLSFHRYWHLPQHAYTYVFLCKCGLEICIFWIMMSMPRACLWEVVPFNIQHISNAIISFGWSVIYRQQLCHRSTQWITFYKFTYGTPILSWCVSFKQRTGLLSLCPAYMTKKTYLYFDYRNFCRCRQ